MAQVSSGSTPREYAENAEKVLLCEYASFSSESRGRQREEKSVPCEPITSATGTESSTATPSRDLSEKLRYFSTPPATITEQGLPTPSRWRR